MFLLAPVIRTVERIELPSTRQPRIWALFCVVNLFIMTIMLEQSGSVKYFFLQVVLFVDKSMPIYCNKDKRVLSIAIRLSSEGELLSNSPSHDSPEQFCYQHHGFWVSRGPTKDRLTC